MWLAFGLNPPAVWVTPSNSTQSSSFSWVASAAFFISSRGHSHSLPALSFIFSNRLPRAAISDMAASFA
jgi:hypothetical protein